MKKILLFLIALLLNLPSFAYAGLELSVDRNPLSFGLMELTEEKELARYGGYEHEVTASSTNGNTWYLKINILRPLTSAEDTIPLEYFKWQATTLNGSGALARPYQFNEFSLFPELVYTSSVDENSGTEVTLQFKYRLKIPEVQIRGSYTTVIRFTLTEVL